MAFWSHHASSRQRPPERSQRESESAAGVWKELRLQDSLLDSSRRRTLRRIAAAQSFQVLSCGGTEDIHGRWSEDKSFHRAPSLVDLCGSQSRRATGRHPRGLFQRRSLWVPPARLTARHRECSQDPGTVRTFCCGRSLRGLSAHRKRERQKLKHTHAHVSWHVVPSDFIGHCTARRRRDGSERR